MYDELVKRLREHGEFLIASDRMKAPPNVKVRNVFAEDYAQAADAIEELQKRVPPAPHGRLIDADKLGFAMMDAANADQALTMVDDAPTVIEAEEGDG